MEHKIRVVHYKVSANTYRQFIKENKTRRLTKFEKIYTDDPIPYDILNLTETEIFDSKVDKLDYTEKSYPNIKYHGENNHAYFFESKNGNKYRLDFGILEENNKNLKDNRLHNKKFISVSFSTSNATNDVEYDKETNFDEIYDLMVRIKYLIDIYRKNVDENNYIFMFGQPDPDRDEKRKLYTYFIKVCFPDYILIKDNTSGFPKINIGYYLLKTN